MSLTFVVSPTLKSATLPTVRQTTGTFWSSGATTKPTSGTARPAQPAPSPTHTRARKRRRSGDTAAAPSGVGVELAGGVVFILRHARISPIQWKSAYEEQRPADEAHDEAS